HGTRIRRGAPCRLIGIAVRLYFCDGRRDSRKAGEILRGSATWVSDGSLSLSCLVALRLSGERRGLRAWVGIAEGDGRRASGGDSGGVAGEADEGARAGRDGPGEARDAAEADCGAGRGSSARRAGGEDSKNA